MTPDQSEVDMNRRNFLKTLLASSVLSNTLIAAAGSLIEVKHEMLSFASGYDRCLDETWLRVSYLLPDGREWHTMSYRKGGDYTNDDEGMEIMWKSQEATLSRTLELI